MTKNITPVNPLSDMAIYKSDDGSVKVNLVVDWNTLWLNQLGIGELFGVQKAAIAKHIDNILEEQELEYEATVSKMETVQIEWLREVKRSVLFYNLDMIIAVWYRVSSKKATQFRIWSNAIIKEYLIKWFALDDERLKNPRKALYFDELLERIRSIRSSERVFYQKITDIYAQCSIDYDPDSLETKTFFATVQNKLHRAITKQTAAEIIHSRVDIDKPNIWLTSRKNSPSWPIIKTDVWIAKNYLSQDELVKLNHFVTMYLDYAENQALRNNAMTMKDRVMRLDAFLEFNEYEILNDSWTVSHEVAIALAEQAFDSYQQKQDYLYRSDFDRFVQIIQSNKQ